MNCRCKLVPSNFFLDMPCSRKVLGCYVIVYSLSFLPSSLANASYVFPYCFSLLHGDLLSYQYHRSDSYSEGFPHESTCCGYASANG